MKYYITKTEKVKRKHLNSTSCDKCGCVIPEESQGNRRKFELKFAAGYGYIDGGSMEGWQVEDLCDDCVSILKDLLSQNGFNISDYEIDW